MLLSVQSASAAIFINQTATTGTQGIGASSMIGQNFTTPNYANASVYKLDYVEVMAGTGAAAQTVSMTISNSTYTSANITASIPGATGLVRFNFSDVLLISNQANYNFTITNPTGGININVGISAGSPYGGGNLWIDSLPLDLIDMQFNLSLSPHDNVGNWTFNQASGNYANDSSGFNNNGTLTNSPTWATNYNNGSVNSTSLSFGGTNEYINVPTNDSLNLTYGATISFWYKPNASLSTQALAGLVVRSTAADADYFSLVTGDNIRSGFKNTAGTEYNIDPVDSIPSANTWYHYVWTFNGSNQVIYINGVQNNISSQGAGQTIRGSNNALSIGAWATFSKYFNGTMDEVKLYNYALNQSEITALYNQHAPTPAYPVANINLTAAYPPLTTSVSFSWHDSQYPADRLQVAEDSGFNIMVVDTYTSADSYTASLESGKTYYWKVTQYNGTTGLSGNVSENQKFTILAASASSDGTTGINGIIYETINGVKTPLSSAQVFIYNNSWSKTMFTGSNGYYVFSSLEANSVYYITAKKENYEDSAIQTVNTTSATWVVHDIPLIRCISVYCGYYNQQYVQFVLQSLFGTKYPNVAVSVYKGSEASTTYTGTTASDGSITFLLTKDQSYRITFINATQGINREVTLIPVELLYVIIVPLTNSPWQEYSEQIKDAIHINVSKSVPNATIGLINISYLDDLNETTALTVYINQSNASDPYNQSVRATWIASLPANNTNHSFAISGYSGQQYLVHLVATHDTYGTIDRTYVVIFDKSASVTGIPDIAWAFLGVILMVFTGAVFTFSTSEKGLMIVCAEGWIFVFLGWFDSLNKTQIGVALGVVSVLAVMAYISRSQKMEGYA